MTKTNCTTREFNNQQKTTARAAFIAKAKVKYGDAYSYDKVTMQGAKDKITITCKTHGDFLKRADHFLNGSTCPKRSGGYALKRRIKTFLRKAREVHGGRYDYSKVEYVRRGEPVKIKCKKHGYFLQKPGDHLAGKGCRTCGAEISSGWSRTDYINKARNRNNGKAKLYVVKCIKNEEVFYKIGITFKSVSTRFYKIPYDYEEIKTLEGEAGFIYDTEKEFHQMNKEYKYTPSIPFAGHTECFSEISQDALFLLDVI